MRSLQPTAVLAVIASVAVIAGVVLLTGAAWGAVVGAGCGLLTAGFAGLAASFLLYDPVSKRDQ